MAVETTHRIEVLSVEEAVPFPLRLLVETKVLYCRVVAVAVFLVE
jgi:hypothetical protein